MFFVLFRTNIRPKKALYLKFEKKKKKFRQYLSFLSKKCYNLNFKFEMLNDVYFV